MRFVWSVLFLAVVIGRLFAQTVAPPLTQLPKFEVASVKAVDPNAPVLSREFGPRPGGRFIAERVTVAALLQRVLNLRDFQVTGGPSWVRTDQFNINAKSETDVPSDQLYLMVRSLLADRFKLATHTEMRGFTVYVLERPAPAVPFGHGIKPIDCSKTDLQERLRNSTLNVIALKPDALVPCGVNYMRDGKVRAAGVTMANIASMLSSAMGEVVLDRTGLAGTYSINVDFNTVEPSGAPPIGAGPSPALVTEPTSVIKAMRDQGFGLVRRTENLEAVVIDRVEKPTPD
jgi:uncharacterized protein (TIGR03435 family)